MLGGSPSSNPVAYSQLGETPHVLYVRYRFLPLISQTSQIYGPQHPRIHPIMFLGINYVFQWHLSRCGAPFAALRIQNTLRRSYVLYVRTKSRKSSKNRGIRTETIAEHQRTICSNYLAALKWNRTTIPLGFWFKPGFFTF